MSNPCEASSTFVLHSGATPGSEAHFHTPDACCDQEGGRKAIDHATLLVSECARYFAVKSVVDRIITALLMVVALPLMLLVGLAIVLIDGRPVFYRQTRVGKNGRVFRIWKFRTMCRNAENATGVVWSSDTDPRVTALGRWLRCSHLDELPQFLNVLAGDMNLIGPRPERPEFVRELVVELPYYAERLRVPPGITGLAQLRFGYDQSLADVKRKALLDAEYVRTADLLLDVGILLFTIPYVAQQVARKWKADSKKADPKRRNDASSPGTVGSPASGISTCVRRPKPALAHEFKPHIPYLLDTYMGFSTSNTDGVAPAADDGL